MEKFKIVDSIIDHKEALRIGRAGLNEVKKYTGELLFSDGCHLTHESISDPDWIYSHLLPKVRTEFSKTPIGFHSEILVENERIEIHKCQLIFKCVKFKTPIPMMLYRARVKFLHKEMQQINDQLCDHFETKVGSLYTIGSKFGGNLTFHTDPFKWRYHQIVQLFNNKPQTVLEFIDGTKVTCEPEQAYILNRGDIPHRALSYGGHQEKIFLSCSPK